VIRSGARAASRVAALAGAAALTAGIVACGGGGESGGGGGGGGGGGEEVIVGLITKTESNPYFVKMREGAKAAADKAGAELITAAGKADNDNQSQVAAVESMTSRGAKGILINPADSEAIVPAIEKARQAGVLVIALDTPTEPQSAADALFATDNKKAGVLIGQYAKAKAEAENIDPKIAMLDLAPGISVGRLRHDGFLQGFGIKEGDDAIIGAADTLGETAKGQTAMETLLQKNPDVNIVYSINEPSGFGGANALRAAGKKPDDVIVTSVDGGCNAIEKGIKTGVIDATSQQYPLKMAQLGVEAVVEFAKSGKKPSG
jgi:fructose transport system substrate-binding protein